MFICSYLLGTSLLHLSLLIGSPHCLLSRRAQQRDRNLSADLIVMSFSILTITIFHVTVVYNPRTVQATLLFISLIILRRNTLMMLATLCASFMANTLISLFLYDSHISMLL